MFTPILQSPPGPDQGCDGFGPAFRLSQISAFKICLSPIKELIQLRQTSSGRAGRKMLVQPPAAHGDGRRLKPKGMRQRLSALPQTPAVIDGDPVKALALPRNLRLIGFIDHG